MNQTAGTGQQAHSLMPLIADLPDFVPCDTDRQRDQQALTRALPKGPFPRRRASCTGSPHDPIQSLRRASHDPQDAAACTAKPVENAPACVPGGPAHASCRAQQALCRPAQPGRTLGLGLALLLALPFAGGCAARQEAPAIDEAGAFVDRRLMDAGDAIARDLALLAGTRGLAGSPLAPAPGTPLAEPLSLHWDGPLEGALAQVCALTGLKLAIAGHVPDIPPQVHIRTARRPCRDVLEDLSRQAGPCASISIDGDARLVRLWYLEPPATLRSQACAVPAMPAKGAKPAGQARPARPGA